MDPAQDRRARWAVSALFFVNGAAWGGWVPHIPQVQEHLRLSDSLLGLALLAAATGAVTTMPFAGFQIHRFGSRAVAALAGLGFLLLVPLLPQMPSLAAFVGLLYFAGVMNGQMDVAMNAHSVAVQHRFPFPILSAVHGWFSVGGFAGGTGAALAARAGLSASVHLTIASVVLATLLATCYRSLLPGSVDRDAEGPRLALPRGPVLVLGIMIFFAFVCEGALWDWTAVYLRNVAQTSAAGAAMGFGVFAAGMAAGRFAGDSAIHRFGEVRVFLVSAVLASAGIFAFVGLPVGAAYPSLVLCGLGIANIVPIIFRAAGTLPGISAGAGLAMVTTCGYTGALSGPPIVGFLSDLRSLSFALGVLAVVCTLLGLSSGVLRRRSTLG